MQSTSGRPRRPRTPGSTPSRPARTRSSCSPGRRGTRGRRSPCSRSSSPRSSRGSRYHSGVRTNGYTHRKVFGGVALRRTRARGRRVNSAGLTTPMNVHVSSRSRPAVVRRNSTRNALHVLGRAAHQPEHQVGVGAEPHRRVGAADVDRAPPTTCRGSRPPGRASRQVVGVAELVAEVVAAPRTPGRGRRSCRSSNRLLAHRGAPSRCASDLLGRLARAADAIGDAHAVVGAVPRRRYPRAAPRGSAATRSRCPSSYCGIDARPPHDRRRARACRAAARPPRGCRAQRLDQLVVVASRTSSSPTAPT